MVRLSALTYSDIMVSRYCIYHVRIQVISAASVHLSGRKLAEYLHTLFYDRLYMPARMSLVVTVIPGQDVFCHVLLQRPGDFGYKGLMHSLSVMMVLIVRLGPDRELEIVEIHNQLYQLLPAPAVPVIMMY